MTALIPPIKSISGIWNLKLPPDDLLLPGTPKSKDGGGITSGSSTGSGGNISSDTLTISTLSVFGGQYLSPACLSFPGEGQGALTHSSHVWFGSSGL